MIEVLYKIPIFALEISYYQVVNYFKSRIKATKVTNKFEIMARKKQIIQVPLENVEKLAKVMQVSKVTVWNALAYRSDSDNAQRIRQLALSDYGGMKTFKFV